MDHSNPRARRIVGKLRIDFRPAFQTERDIETCLCGLTGRGPNPDSDMDTSWFDEELNEAWNRLTPGQQVAVLQTVTSYRATKLETQGRSLLRQAMIWKHGTDPDYDDRYLVP